MTPGSVESISRPCHAVPLRSEARVRQLQVARVVGACEYPVKAHRLVILEDAESWVVSDIRIDDVSQFSSCGDVPGDVFAEGVVDGFVRFSEGSRFEAVVTYIGFDPEGGQFSAEFRSWRDEAS